VRSSDTTGSTDQFHVRTFGLHPLFALPSHEDTKLVRSLANFFGLLAPDPPEVSSAVLPTVAAGLATLVQAHVVTACSPPVSSYLLVEDALTVEPLAGLLGPLAPAPLESVAATAAVTTCASAGPGAKPSPVAFLCLPPRTLAFLPLVTNAVQLLAHLLGPPAPSPLKDTTAGAATAATL